MSFYLFCQPIAAPHASNPTPHTQNHSVNMIYGHQSLFGLLTLRNNFPLIYLNQSISITPSSQLQPQTTSQTSCGKNRVRIQKEKRRRLCLQKQIKSAKKNGESNLINQLFSFLSQPQRSSKIVKEVLSKVIKSGVSIQKVQQLFYNIVRFINLKRGRKYMNKNILASYFKGEQMEAQETRISSLLTQQQLISIQEFCCCFRIICYQFIKNQSVNVILTSRRISLVAKLSHLKRKRILQNFMKNVFQTN